MGYYHICIIKEAINLCTIILPWEKYKYKRLPMGVCNSQEILQAKMNIIFHGFEFIISYIDDPLIITKGNWSNHLNKLELVPQNLKDTKIKCNIGK